MKRPGATQLLALGLLVVAAADFVIRVHVPRGATSRDAESFAPVAIAAAPSAKAIAGELASWLPRLRPVEAPSGAESPEDWTLTLLAVFDDRAARFAVVRAQSPVSGQQKSMRVAEGEELLGFRVVDIGQTSVTLEGKSGQSVLALFKPGESSLGGAAPLPAAGDTHALPGSPAAQVPPPGSAGVAKSTPASARPAAAAAGPEVVESREIKPGESVALPESMKGMKVEEAKPNGVVVKKRRKLPPQTPPPGP